MFSKIKGTVLWASLLAIPVAAVVFAVKYYMGKQSGQPVDIDEVAESVANVVKNTAAFAKKVFCNI
jgi:hypothetical protein